jgi:hypothetical protein
MASPFSKYTGEQIQPINILPYTGEMARMQYEAISGLGKDIGEAIKGYQAARDERETMAQIAGGVIGDFVEQDLQNPEDKAVYRPKVDAPRHHSDLIKEALKNGDGDIGVGLASMPITKLRAWSALHTKYEQDVKNTAELELKKRGVAVEEDRIQLAREQAQIAAMNESARLALENYYRNENLNIAKQNADIEKWKTEQAKKAIADQQEKDAALLEIGNEQAPSTIPVTERVTTVNAVGDLFDPKTGDLIVSNVDLKDAIGALGLREDQVITQEQALVLKQQSENYATNQVGKFMTGSQVYDAADTFTTAISKGYAEKFIRETFRNAINRGEEAGQPLQNWEIFFPNGLDGKIASPEKAFDTAKKFVNFPQFTDYMRKKGVQTIPDGAVFDKTFIKTVTGEYTSTQSVTKNFELKEEARELYRYNAVAARFAQAGKKMPFTWNQYKDMFPNRFIPSVEVTLSDGTTQRVFQNGQKGWVPEQAFVGVGASDGKGSLSDKEVMNADNWLKGLNKPITFGNFTVQFAPTDNVPEAGYFGINDFKGIFKEDYPILRDGFQEAQRISQIASEMRQIVKGTNFVQKMLSPEVTRRFEQLRLTAETMRKYFIAGGQETDKDNERLRTVLADLNFWNAFKPETHMKAIDAMEAIVQSRVFNVARNAGFRVKTSRTVNAPDSATIKKLADELEQITKKKTQ